MPPRISVVIPVRDDAANLAALLERLGRQTLPRSEFEVVVGDDGSRDLDPAMVETADGWARIVRQPRRNSYAVRNLAVAHSRGDVLAFIDADCQPARDWLERGLEAMANADVVGGMISFRVDGRVSVWGLIDMESYLDQERNVRGGGLLTANAFVDRALFDRVGGFDESLPSGGDITFARACAKLNARLAFAPHALVWHPPRTRARALLRKVWTTERTFAYRSARSGLPRTPLAATWRTMVPVPGTVRARRRAGAAALDCAKLIEKGARPTSWDRLKALPITCVALPYLRAAAQTVGWLQGRRAPRVA